MAPRKAYFELEAQPARITPYTPIEVSAMMYSSPALIFASISRALNGTTAQAASAGISADRRRQQEQDLVGACAGMMISLISSLRTSAIGCTRPQRAEIDAVRADAHLHPADDLALPQVR